MQTQNMFENCLISYAVHFPNKGTKCTLSKHTKSFLNLFSWFPPGLENLENEKVFSSQGKARNFDKTGKVREFFSKYWKNIDVCKIQQELALIFS